MKEFIDIVEENKPEFMNYDIENSEEIKFFKYNKYIGSIVRMDDLFNIKLRDVDREYFFDNFEMAFDLILLKYKLSFSEFSNRRK